ncbi:MAG: site-specific DNA-methyltransferase, partial [Gammaproteobacteria bacterium]|nr:site-specific DNA-methyltransferase [Gammaproteobacteria bacterium]
HSHTGASGITGLSLSSWLARVGGHVAVNTKTLGWQPGCKCGAEVEPCICLDPFSGSGTVAVVAYRLGRDYIGIEASPEYVQMSEKRLKPYKQQIKLNLK